MHLNKYFLLMAFTIIACSSIYAQNTTSHKDEMKKAIYWVSKAKYDNAKTECIKILQKNPKQADAAVLLAKLYSWEYKFDSARTLLSNVLQNQPANKDALNAMVNVELWSKHYDKALAYANRGLEAYPNAEDFLIKKAKAYEKQGNYTEASKVINKAVEINPDNKEALKVQEILKNKKQVTASKSAVGIYYQNDRFTNNYTPWNYVSAYFYTVSKRGGLSAGINYATRFNITGTQYELNLYPRISKVTRAFIGGGFSKDKIFPEYKFGVSLYQKVFKIAELEGGIRYLSFKKLAPIIIYTGGLSISSGHWRGTIRTFLTPRASTLNQSYQLSARYSFKNPDNRIMLVLSTGLSPQNYLDTVSYKTYNYPKTSNRIELRYQTPFFSDKTILKVAGGYEMNDYYTGKKRERIFAGIGIERSF